ncbi:MAG: replication-relaxation family protein [bacterium]
MIASPNRTKRRDPGRARVTPRELVGLGFIAKAQPVATCAYQHLLGMSRAVARRSLRKLRDLGLVGVNVVAMELPSRYVLGPQAPQVLGRVTGHDPEEFRVPRGIGKVNLDHHDGTVELYVSLRLATARSTTIHLEEFVFEDEIRRTTGAPKGALVPDAVAVFRGQDGRRLAIAFEVDTGSQNPRQVAQRKGLGYAELRAARAPLRGCADWLVCCLTNSERRRNKIVGALWDAGVPEGLWYLGMPEAITDRTILGDAWVTARVQPTSASAALVHESPLQPVITDCDNRSHRSTAGFAKEADHILNDGVRD